MLFWTLAAVADGNEYWRKTIGFSVSDSLNLLSMISWFCVCVCACAHVLLHVVIFSTSLRFSRMYKQWHSISNPSSSRCALIRFSGFFFSSQDTTRRACHFLYHHRCSSFWQETWNCYQRGISWWSHKEKIEAPLMIREDGGILSDRFTCESRT